MHDEIDELIRSRTNGELPADVEVRLRSRLAEFRQQVEHRKPSRWAGLQSLMPSASVWRLAAMSSALLLVLTAGLVLMPRQSRAGQLFSTAAAHLRESQSLAYTIVLNDEPYVAVDFAYLAPGYRNVNCSWGIEIRTDGTTGRQIVLLHGARAYVNESGKTVESTATVENFSAQLRALPDRADELLGERWTGQRKLLGYRLTKAAPNGSIPGLKSQDIWIDSASGQVDHVDITIQEGGKPEHTMHIRGIRAGEAIERALFDLTPPAGYNPLAAVPKQESTLPGRIPEIRLTPEMFAAVIRMKGPYTQTSAALSAVEAYLKEQGISPAGPPLGRFWSEDLWEVGFPVPARSKVEDPLQLVTLPAALTASLVTNGPWGKDSEARWSSFLKSCFEQGYVPAGPTMEIWTGEVAGATQSTEMRIPVMKAN